MSSIHDPAYLPTRFRMMPAHGAPASLSVADVPALILAARVGDATHDALLCGRCAAFLPARVFRAVPVRGPRAYVPCARCGSVTYPPSTDMRTTRLSVCADNL